MNREIKVRAWNKREKRFSLPFTFQSLLSDIAWYDVNEVWLNYGTDTGEYWVLYEPYFHKDEWDILQYTGLKDKNGVEIYEGDVLKFADYRRGYQLQEVEFWSGEFTIRTYPANDDWTSLRVAINGGYLNNGDEMEGSECEVIGNIYQNPELLKK